MVCGHVHDGQVDVTGQLLLGRVTQAAFLQRVTQFGGRQNPGHRLVKAERCGNAELRKVLEVRGHVSTVERLRHVGLGTPNDVVRALHHCAVGVVHSDIAGKNEGVIKAFEDVFERYAFFFTKCICHDWFSKKLV